MLTDPLRYYAVVAIADDTLLYVGQSDTQAAHAWVAGTCHSSGLTEMAAIHNAEKVADQLRTANPDLRKIPLDTLKAKRET